MFGTLGFSELIIILVIVLIIFGAGRLPQIGEGVGKALKGFKKEVNEVPPAPETGEAQANPQIARNAEGQQPAQTGQTQTSQEGAAPESSPRQGGQPYTPGPELTPGTTAAMAAGSIAPPPPSPQPQRSAQPSNQPAQQPGSPAPAQASSQPAAGSQPQPANQPMSMEQRQQTSPPSSRPGYPAVPASAKGKPGSKRPSAIVNKDAVARVRAQQAEKRAKEQGGGAPSPEDMQNLGEGVGDTLRTFRQAVSDVRNTIDPEMRTIQAEMEAAQKEIEDSVEAAKQSTKDQTPPSNS